MEHHELLSPSAQARFSAWIDREPMPDVEFPTQVVDEFEQVYPIIAEFPETMTAGAIASNLNARGMVNSVGKAWDSTSVRRLRERVDLWRSKCGR
jgi:hypothetical protein